jgi:uncharacterized protein YndB with AHSA1/START domain
MADGFVSVSRRIDAPAAQLFALLTDSANHPLIDGSGMVRAPAPAIKVTGTGDAFVMDMYHERFGHYQMRNTIIEYADGQRLTWEPTREIPPTEKPDPDDGAGLYRWGWQFAPDGAGATVVTETFDCTRSPDDLREAVKEGEGWRESMTSSLARLELLAKVAGNA